MSKGISIIIKARRVFNETTQLSLYNSLILPYVSYFIHVCGNAYNTHLKHVMVLQNKAVRVIAGVPTRTNADDLYLELNILPVKKSSTFLAYSCITILMECSQHYFSICLLLSVISIAMIHDRQKTVTCLLPSNQLLEANKLLHILDPMYGILSYPKSTPFVP